MAGPGKQRRKTAQRKARQRAAEIAKAREHRWGAPFNLMRRPRYVAERDSALAIAAGLGIPPHFFAPAPRPLIVDAAPWGLCTPEEIRRDIGRMFEEMTADPMPTVSVAPPDLPAWPGTGPDPRRR